MSLSVSLRADDAQVQLTCSKRYLSSSGNKSCLSAAVRGEALGVEGSRVSGLTELSVSEDAMRPCSLESWAGPGERAQLSGGLQWARESPDQAIFKF